MATRFITVSIEIMHDKNLSPNQKFILAEIQQLSQLDKGCIATNNHFSELIGISKAGVSNAINDLSKKGYIVIDNSNTKRNYGRVITIHSDVPPLHSDVQGIHSDVETKENKTTNKTVNTYSDSFLKLWSIYSEGNKYKANQSYTKFKKTFKTNLEESKNKLKKVLDVELRKESYQKHLTTILNGMIKDIDGYMEEYAEKEIKLKDNQFVKDGVTYSSVTM